MRLGAIASRLADSLREREFSPSSHELNRELDHLVATFSEKVDAVCATIERLKQEEEAAEARKERWAAEAKAAAVRRMWLEQHLLWCLSQVQDGAHKGEFKAKMVRPKGNKVVVHCDPEDLPPDFQRIPKVKPQPDLEQIAAALEAGEVVEGVSLVPIEPYLKIT